MRRKSLINNKKWPRWGSSKFMWLSKVLLRVITFPFDCPSTEQQHARPQLSKERTGKGKKNRTKQADCPAEARTQLPAISSRAATFSPHGEGAVTQTCHRTWSLDSEATAAAVICVCRRPVPRSDTSTLSCHPVELGRSQQSYSLTLACRTTCKKLFASCRCLRRMLQT